MYEGIPTTRCGRIDLIKIVYPLLQGKPWCEQSDQKILAVAARLYRQAIQYKQQEPSKFRDNPRFIQQAEKNYEKYLQAIFNSQESATELENLLWE